MDESDLIQHVSDTALWVAYYRGVESERPDALFQDVFAKKLSGEKGFRIVQSMPERLSRGTQFSLVVRTCIIDDFIRQKVSEGVDTILNLGAGLDTRPYRMNLPSQLLWIEADFPHIIEYKEKIIGSEKPVCRLERAKLNLADHSEREQFLASVNLRSKKVLVLTEGVLPYLSNQEVSSLAKSLHAQSHFLYWIVDYLSEDFHRFYVTRMKRHLKKAPFVFRPGDWLSFFHSEGWKPKEMKYLVPEGFRLNRLPPTPWWMHVTFLLLPKARKERMMKMTAYALMERSS